MRDALDGFKTWAASVWAGLSYVLQICFGDIAVAALQTVVVLCLVDFVLGTAQALAEKSWSCDGLRGGAKKLLVWGALLVVAKQLSAPVGIFWLDRALQSTAQGLYAYLILTDFASVVDHARFLLRQARVATGRLEDIEKALPFGKEDDQP